MPHQAETNRLTRRACLMGASGLALAAGAPGAREADAHACLFASFRGNGEDGLHLAESADGLTWTALAGDRSWLKPTVGRERLMRDPCIARGPDGQFHMVWTCGWWERSIGYASSPDLIQWTEQRELPVMAAEPAARNAWAPEIFHDSAHRRWVIFWASTIPGRFPETEASGDEGCNHRIYAASTPDFQQISAPRLLIEPGFECIDATIVRAAGRYVMVLKDETLRPQPRKNLRVSTARSVLGPWSPPSPAFTPAWVEGPTALNISGRWIVYYDCYTKARYGASSTRDFKTWTDLTDRVTFPPGTRHGSALRIDAATMARLRDAT